MMAERTPASNELLYRVKDVVAAYVSNNSIAPTELPRLISSAHATLGSLTGVPTIEPVSAAPLTPAVPIKKSVTPDHVVCLECGKTFASIKRHLASSHELTPEQYRGRWDLPEGYPLVAPSYSVRRSALAKENGLGRDRGKRAAAG
jgi:predicted transcriptional regulator